MKNDKDLDNNDETTPKKSMKWQQPEKTVSTTKNNPDKRTTMVHKDDDGDEYTPDQAYRNYGDYPPSYTLHEKMTKENALYQQGMPFENCGKCNFYIAGHCKIVRGYIAQGMVCKYFQEKYSPTAFAISIRKK